MTEEDTDKPPCTCPLDRYEDPWCEKHGPFKPSYSGGPGHNSVGYLVRDLSIAG